MVLPGRRVCSCPRCTHKLTRARAMHPRLMYLPVRLHCSCWSCINHHTCLLSVLVLMLMLQHPSPAGDGASVLVLDGVPSTSAILKFRWVGWVCHHAIPASVPVPTGVALQGGGWSQMGPVPALGHLGWVAGGCCDACRQRSPCLTLRAAQPCMLLPPPLPDRLPACLRLACSCPLNCADPSPDGRWLAVGYDEPAIFLVPAGTE